MDKEFITLLLNLVAMAVVIVCFLVMISTKKPAPIVKSPCHLEGAYFAIWYDHERFTVRWSFYGDDEDADKPAWEYYLSGHRAGSLDAENFEFGVSELQPTFESSVYLIENFIKNNNL